MIWPPGLWAREREFFLRTAETPAQRRRFMRTLSENASNFEMDAQGRLLLTAGQRSFAQIVDQVVFLGVGTGVEIVADEIWQSEHSTVQPAEDFTQVWDVVHQRGSVRILVAGVSAPDGFASIHDHPPVVRGRHGDSR